MYTRYDKKEIKLQKNRMKEVDKKKPLSPVEVIFYAIEFCWKNKKKITIELKPNKSLKKLNLIYNNIILRK
jgi:hypothetical protein